MSFPDSVPPVIQPPPGYTFPAAPGAAGVLTNDGTGALSWLPGGGGGATLPTPVDPRDADRVLMTPKTAPLTPFWSDTLEFGGF